jgi:hypothetical protein
VYIFVFLHTLIYNDIGKFASLHPYVPTPPATVSWSSETRVRHVEHPRRWAPIVDRHDHIFSREWRHIALIGDLVHFHASGEGSRGHDILHHAIVLEPMLDGVGVVWASPLKELLEVVHWLSRLTLSAAYNSHDAYHAGAAPLACCCHRRHRPWLRPPKDANCASSCHPWCPPQCLGWHCQTTPPYCCSRLGKVGLPRSWPHTGRRYYAAPRWCS